MKKTVQLIFLANIVIMSSCQKFILNNEDFAATSKHKGYIILETNGIMVQTKDLSNEADYYTAEIMCAKSSIGGFDDWRLPTKAELSILYNKRKEIGGFNLSGGYKGTYWSSDYISGNYYPHECVNFYNGKIEDASSNFQRAVRAVRSLP